MNKNIYAIDIETNGVSRYSCDIIQIGIVDSNLNKLYSSCCKPIKLQTWNLNETPCKITPESLKDFPTIVEQRDEIVKILNQADVIVSFNGEEFDIPFIEQVLDYKVKAQSYDIMKYAWKEFALYGNKSPMLRPSLADVCNWFGVNNEEEHDAAADAKATMEVFLKMTEESKKPKLITITTFDDEKKIYTEELADKYAKESGAKIVEVKYYEKDSKGLKEIGKPSDLSKYRVGNFVKGTKKQKEDKYYLMCLNENGVDKVYLGENDTEVDDFEFIKLFTKEEAEAKKKELASKGQDYWDVEKD